MNWLNKQFTIKIYLLRHALFVLGFLFSSVLWGQTDPLATGKWKTLRIEESTVVTLSQQDFIDLGFDVSAIDPRDIRVFANMGEGYPAENPEIVHATAPEVPLYFPGGEDGVFNEQDKAQFYIQGTQTWFQRGSFIERKLNLYTDEVVFYIGYDEGVRGKRIITSKDQLNEMHQ